MRCNDNRLPWKSRICDHRNNLVLHYHLPSQRDKQQWRCCRHAIIFKHRSWIDHAITFQYRSRIDHGVHFLWYFYRVSDFNLHNHFMCPRSYELPSEVDPIGNYDFVVLYYCVPYYQHSLPGHVVGSLGNRWELRGLSIFGRWKCCSNLDSSGVFVFSGWNCWRKFCSSRICILGGWRCSPNFYPASICILGGWNCWRKLYSSRICLFGGRRGSSKFYSARIRVFRGWSCWRKLYPTSICLFSSWGFCTKLNSTGLFFCSWSSYPKPILASWTLDINRIPINNNFSSHRTINNHCCSGPRFHEHRSTIWSR
jgi:hypothetical protein